MEKNWLFSDIISKISANNPTKSAKNLVHPPTKTAKNPVHPPTKTAKNLAAPPTKIAKNLVPPLGILLPPQWGLLNGP